MSSRTKENAKKDFSLKPNWMFTSKLFTKICCLSTLFEKSCAQKWNINGNIVLTGTLNFQSPNFSTQLTISLLKKLGLKSNLNCHKKMKHNWIQIKAFQRVYRTIRFIIREVFIANNSSFQVSWWDRGKYRNSQKISIVKYFF